MRCLLILKLQHQSPKQMVEGCVPTRRTIVSPAGRVDFCTFFGSLPRLLVFDRANAVEIAFRMCSRWGATVTLENAILDDKDIRRIVEQRLVELSRRPENFSSARKIPTSFPCC